jgi:hypothetical protein
MGRHAVLDHGGLEDLRLAQALVGGGMRLFLVHGEPFLETRMYRSLTMIAEDWTGGVPPASRSTVAPWASGLAPWVVAGLPLFLFVVPIVLLVISLFVPALRALTAWGAIVTGLSLVFWLVVCAWHRIRPAYAVVYPAGALLTSVIFVRSLVRWERHRERGPRRGAGTALGG